MSEYTVYPSPTYPRPPRPGIKRRQYFYSMMRDGKFINSNSMKEDTDNVAEAISFNTEDDALTYWEQPYTKLLREANECKIVEIEYIVRDL